MTEFEKLESLVETLGLKAVQARLPNLLEQASQKEPGYAEFLLDTLKTEADARRSRYLRARLQLGPRRGQEPGWELQPQRAAERTGRTLPLPLGSKL